MIRFAAYTTAQTPNAFQWAGQPHNTAPSHEESRHPSNTDSWAHPSLPSNRHLDRSVSFCGAYKHTNRQTTLLRL